MTLFLNDKTFISVLMNVFLFTIIGLAVEQSPLQPNLALSLYLEDDWEYAKVEAHRQILANSAGSSNPLNQAILLLSDQQMHPVTTNRMAEIRFWVNTNPDHPYVGWVQKQWDDIKSKAKTEIRPTDGIADQIASAVIGFYQHQIGPAIGQRCAMHPSCSHYAMQAFEQHGIIGVPMMTDRLVRESMHIQNHINPISLNGITKYYDPIEMHTYWFKRKRQP